MLSTWVVVRDVEVAAADLGPDGLLLDGSIDGWIALCAEDYLLACPALGAVELSRTWTRPPAALLGRPAGLALSATISEVLPSALVMRIRLRPLDGDVDRPADTQCRLELIGPDGSSLPIDRALRDEIIAAERTARFYN